MSQEKVLIFFGSVRQGGYSEGLLKKLFPGKDKIFVVSTSSEEILKKFHKKLITLDWNLRCGIDSIVEHCPSKGLDPFSSIGIENWSEAIVDWDYISHLESSSTQHLRQNTLGYFKEIFKNISNSADITIVHNMAGGSPRNSGSLEIMSRIIRGTNKRFFSSQSFFNSSSGQLYLKNFELVSATSYKVMVDCALEIFSEQSREGLLKSIAFGYIGNDVELENKTVWNCLIPYMPGLAKKKLELISSQFSTSDIQSTVYNCPEVVSGSSQYFLGIDLHMYPFIEILQSLKSEMALGYIHILREMLSIPHKLDELLDHSRSYIYSEFVEGKINKENFPIHNNNEQMLKMVQLSSVCQKMNKNVKNPVKNTLSKIIISATCNYIAGNIDKNQGATVDLSHRAISEHL